MPSGDALVGATIGLAVGDALGLPYEGLSKRRVARFAPGPRMAFLGRRGMASDDTDHAELVLIALAASGGDPDIFAAVLGRGLRRWFLTLPAGIGMATARACLKLCVGVPASRSGVFSAGNGPLMRAPIIGAAIADPAMRAALVRASTLVTHTDPLALTWAMITAEAAAALATDNASAERLRAITDAFALDARSRAVCDQLHASLASDEPTEAFAQKLGCGHAVSGFVLHSGPVALHAALTHPGDLAAACRAAIRCGGDTDTTAAIAGGLVGARLGAKVLDEPPTAELAGAIIDWPRGIASLSAAARQAAASVAQGERSRVRHAAYPLVFARNLAFLVLVLAHGLRRLAPPW